MTSDSLRPRAPIHRPALARWVWDRGYTWKEAGELFGCSGEAVRLWCQPFDDTNRRQPEAIWINRIVARTDGAITAADFYPPHVSARPSAENAPSPTASSEAVQ